MLTWNLKVLDFSEDYSGQYATFQITMLKYIPEVDQWAFHAQWLDEAKERQK